MLSGTNPDVAIFLLANMNALVGDLVSRQKLGGTSFKYFTMKQIAYLPRAFFTLPNASHSSLLASSN